MLCKPCSYEHFQCTPLYMIRNAGASELPVLLRMSIRSFCRHRTPRPFAPNDEFSDQMKVLFLKPLYKKDSYIHNELTDKSCILFVVFLVSSHLKPSTYYCDVSWRDMVKNLIRAKCVLVCSVVLGVEGGGGWTKKTCVLLLPPMTSDVSHPGWCFPPLG